MDTVDWYESQGAKYSPQGDLGNSLAAGAGDVGAALSSAVGWVADQAASSGSPDFQALSNTMEGWRKASNAFVEGRNQDMSPSFQQLMSSSPFSSQAAGNPFMYIAGQTARLAPTVVATIASTALTADPMVGAAMLGATGGVLSMGDVTNQINSTIDSIPDAQLQSTDPVYKQLRDSGMDEAAARKRYRGVVAGAAPAVAFTIGAAANLLGGPGQLARAFGKEVAGGALDLEGKNIIQRTIAGAAVGGGVGAAQGGLTNITTQAPLSSAGLKPFDSQQLVDATLGGGVMGGAMGGVAEGIGGIGHGKPKTVDVSKGATKNPKIESVEPASPDAAQTLAMDSTQERIPPEVTAPPVVSQPAPQPEMVQRAPQPVETPAAPPTPVETPQGAQAPIPEAAPAEPAPQAMPAPEAATQAAPGQEAAPVVAPPAEQAPAENAIPVPAAPPAGTKTVASHDALFSAAAKPKAIAAAISKIADLSGVPVDRVSDMLKARTEGRDVAGIRSAIKDTLASLAETNQDNQGAKHRTTVEVQIRQDANTTAQDIAAKYPPNPEVEGAALGSANDPGVKPARAAVAKRVAAMAADASKQIAKPLAEQNVAFPTRFKDNADASTDWNGHMMLLSEAQRLAKKINNKTATSSDYQRFLSREADLRAGNSAAVKSERRAEGDMAFRKGVVDTTGDIAVSAPETVSGTDFEAPSEQVTTKVSKLAKRPIAEGKTGPASAVRKVELSAEEKAALEKRMAPKVAEAVEKAKAKPEPAPITPKVASVKARIAAAAKQVDRNPTEAQKVAGTYQKGHVSVHGLDITIENPKGSTRSGVGPDGKPWSVKMPDHYGYIKRTEGADGDHVDVYIGPHPESDHVFLVEQRNAETGAFDEHKAMLGYDNVAQAADAYDRAFSDGKAADRFGSVKPMSVDEFKTWLKSDTTRPTDEYRSTTKALAQSRETIPLAQTRGEPTPFVKARNAVASYLNGLSDRDYLALEDRWSAHESNPEHLSIAQALDDAKGPREALELGQTLKSLHDEGNALSITDNMGTTNSELRQYNLDDVVQATRASEAKRTEYLNSLGKQHNLGGALQKVLNFRARAARDGQLEERPFWMRQARGQLANALAPTVIARVKALAGDVPLHVVSDEEFAKVGGSQNSSGFYNSVSHQIIIRESAMDASNPDRASHVLLHEALHAAFRVSMEENPHIARVTNAIMDEARAAGIHNSGGAYALTNEHEFIAEAFSNPDVGEFLANTPASPELSKLLGLKKPASSLWETMVEVVRQALGLPKGSESLLHAMMRVADELDKRTAPAAHGLRDEHILNIARQRNDQVATKKAALARATRENPKGWGTVEVASHLTTDAIGKTIDDVKSAVESAVTGKGMVKQMPAPKLLELHTFDQIAAKASRYFEGNPVRHVFNAIEAMRVSAMKAMQSFEPEIMQLHKMADKYRGPVFDDFAQLMHDSTMAGVYPNRDLLDPENAHISKSGHTDAWQRAVHGELKAKFDALPQELKDTYVQAANFFRDKQNTMALSAIQNRILVALGVEDKGLASRVFNETATDADKKLLGPAYDVIKQAGELSRIDGPYFPLMRRGNYAVTGEYHVADPKSANFTRRLADGKYEFNDKDEASKFATFDEKGKVRDIRPTVRGVWVDSRTGDEYGTDADGERVKITPQDTYAQQRWRVALQNKHVEFVDTKTQAAKLAYELQQSGLKNVDYQEKLYQPTSPRGDMLSTEAKAVMSIIEKRDAYSKMTPTQQAEVQQALSELSLRFLGSTRVQSRALPRRYVAGASKDVVRNTYEYAQSVANYLGKLQHAPELDKAIEAMHAQTVGHYDKDTSLGRSSIYNEVMKRVTNFTPIAGDTKAFSAVTKRFMMLSFLDKLMSPSHSVINAMQPGMLSFPILGGRHGLGKSFAAMAKAYDDIGAINTLKSGVKKTLEHAVKPSTADLATFVEDILARAKTSGERSMLQFMVDHGTIDPDAGFEVGRMISHNNGVAGKFDQGLNYLDGIARQMPRAVETVNRAVTALAAYRLELAKTGDHEKAVNYAQEVTNTTQGIYSSSNAPPVFNNPLLRMSLQFKKYGQMVYALLGHQVGKAILNAQPGDRAEAVKALGTLAAMHIAIAGTLGLPTEPFKWLLLGANIAGVTDYKWSDVENWERQVLAHVAGRGAGEVLARGVTRLIPGGLGFDLSGRAGLQDLMTFGEPTSNNTNDLWAYFGQLIGGAPGGLALDYIKGAQALSAGNFEQAAELMVPMKAAADALTAYRKMTEGKVSKSGRQTMQPYDLQQALVRTFGFTPEAEAENSDRQTAYNTETNRIGTERTNYQQQWFQANSAERLRLWGQIEKWNKGMDQQNRLTRAQLDAYTQRRNADVTSGRVTNGLNVTPRTRSILNQTNQTYNG